MTPDEIERLPKVVLIGGTSHAGKSTLARHLSERFGGPWLSTDSLAQHPGRPWPKGDWIPPAHVAAHYRELTVDQLLESVLVHYRTMRPLIEERTRAHLAGGAAGPLVLEGSALWPDTVAALRTASASAIWLTAADDVIERRMRAESRYDDADSEGRMLIDKFLARTLRFNRVMLERIRALDFAYLEVLESMSLEEIGDLCLLRMRPLA